ncbi:MAG: CBS domain-containing protein, partial [Bilophila sp.]
MIWDFTWIGDPSAWFGLGTLIVIEVVLGIDNIVFISILASRLPEHQKQRAFSLGLTLALLMRLVLLSAIAWIVTLTRPLIELGGHSFSARDLILLLGGLFLLLKGTLELHERLEGHTAQTDGAVRNGVFWQVIVQILVLDAVFSLDSVITSVGMVKELPVMMLAVIVAMLTMLIAARPLMAFVERHPSVIVLCLGFLLMIGLSLIMDGFGLHIPKGYLYAAIAFSVLVETFNQLVLRNRRKHLTPRNFRDSAAKAVLGLLSGKSATDGASQLDMAALASDGKRDAIFAPEECAMVARVIRLGGRTVRYVMTPRRKMYCLTEGTDRQELLRVAMAAPYASIPVQQAMTDEVSGVVHLGELLNALEGNAPIDLTRMARPVPTVLEHASLPDLLDIFRRHPVPLVLVGDEYGSVVGMVTPED